ncbi:GspH/FimT family pseudopilin [bacterium]|nr:GspH/FimT family pseudopilin [bacterium]
MTLPIGLKANKRGFGFTLIELTMVVLVLSIIVSIAVPRFRKTYETIKFRNTAYNIVKLMSYARDRAIIERRPFRVEFSDEEDAFWLAEYIVPEEGNKEDGEFEMVAGSVGRRQMIPLGITIDIDEPSRQNYVTFYPDGQADPFVMYLEGGDDFTYTITTKKMVGLIRLYQEKIRL